MRYLKNSISKRLYARRVSSARCAEIWLGQYRADAVTSYSQEMQDEIRENGSVWLVTVVASKH